MTVETSDFEYYYTLENLEKAKELVALVLSERSFLLRPHIKSGYSSLRSDYNERYRDWSNYTNQFLRSIKNWSNPMYTIWNGIRCRCYNVNDISYAYYGQRGVTMCDDWLYHFSYFADDVLLTIGRKPHPFYTIDRINNKGDYEPGNIRWASPLKQARNRNGLKISETAGLALAILYKYYIVTGLQLKDIYNNYLAENEECKITKSWKPIYTAAKSYNEFV